MNRWLVMPRGINVGTKNRVPMADLRKELEAAGFDEVVSIGQSGNVIVSREGTEDEIVSQVKAVIAKSFGVDVEAVVRSADEVKAVLTSNPLADLAVDGAKYLAIFLSAAPGKKEAEALLAEDVSPEVVKVDGRTVFVWTPNGVKAMRVNHTALEKRFGVTATARNWNTLEKIAAKF